MSSQLDPEILAAITAEARQCFLDEDAPEYLQMLEEGIKDPDSPDFTALLRAAHSLKGGAGLASLTSLQHLAHRLEDVLVGIQGEQIAERELAWALIEKGIDEVGFVLSQARTVDDAIANPELITALEALVGTSSETEECSTTDDDGGTSQNNHLVWNTLTVELENSFIVIEELELDAPDEVIQPLLADFADECIFMAETLDLPWLGEAMEPITEALENSETVEVLLLTKEIIHHLRDEIQNYLSHLASDESEEEQEGQPEGINVLVVNTLNEDLEAILQAIADLALDTPEEVITEALTGFADECTFMGETLELPWLAEAVAPIETILTEADPIEALLVSQELVQEIRQRRNLYLENLQSENINLEDTNLEDASDSEAFAISELDNEYEELGEVEDVEGFFDFPDDDEGEELSTVMFAPPVVSKSESKIIATVAEKSKKPAVNQLKIPLKRLEEMTNNVEELILSQSRISRQQQILNQANHRLRSLTRQFEPIREQIQNLYDQLAVRSTDMSQPGDTAANTTGDDRVLSNDSFDTLEMDRYTDLHTSLQSFQELMLQIQETRTDIDFVERELVDDLELNQKNLDTLYSKITDSRLVTFDTLAKRFVPQIKGLSQRFDKPVNLEIEGKNTLVDQILLEQLQTPLTHLLNNAFDHGIEAKYDRIAAGKSETATILLTAKLQNNQLVITIQDDGSGINIEKVYNRAVQRGICPANKSIKDFKPETILNWIFEPDFSTAAQVSDISGRGMGLDIVLNLIRQLKGQLRVQTDAGLGSIFTINLPLNLSLQSLLLVQLHDRLVAFPHTSILEMLPERELDFTDKHKQHLNWQGQVIALASVSSLFPCPRKTLKLSQGKVAMVLKTAFEPLVILVDDIVKEEKLIIKPFDETIPVPPYIAGCTVLGTGEVIPVILPQGLEQDAVAEVSAKDSAVTIVSGTSTVLIAEDSVATRRMLEKILIASGYQVIVCRDGQEALEQIDQYKGRIDLIVSDIEMPRLNGFELLEQVRVKPAFKNTPIVMATSRTGDRHKQEAKRLGATDYLGKPVQPQELVDVVAALLAKK
ncbi:response regulator [Pleurocapsa sp. PCC 7319]|uniref:response regulator n=1 Tax=Pleurocapsa sp. PCC 7319 TaxID=118161 RepID=UPI00034C4B44|nr:response regulator [Pleurocapsa sp. PCC 7319]